VKEIKEEKYREGKIIKRDGEEERRIQEEWKEKKILSVLLSISAC
jgi:hypothetical protein